MIIELVQISEESISISVFNIWVVLITCIPIDLKLSATAIHCNVIDAD